MNDTNLQEDRPDQTSPKESDATFQPQFTIVAIGASAGGLEALQIFFDQMPPDTGMAFVVVMHLSPEHRSHLPQLLQSHTEMPVRQVTQTIAMAPNHIYVIPPNRNLSSIDTHLRLSELEAARRQRAPIDHFLRTLAKTHGEQAIGVVLSGTGSDGSLGLKEIKEAGGLTVVQDPVEAEYDSMPQNAIATGLIDLILPVAEMPAQIGNYVRVGPSLRATETEMLPEVEGDQLQKILLQLRTHTGHDFSGYKQNTVLRRVRRRMQLQHIEDLSTYLQLLRSDEEEIKVLSRDLLITVTKFFRDEEAFTALEEQVIPRLFADKGSGDRVRVWVVGCATGEEAYSVAMLLLEQCARMADAPMVQVFASDISNDALMQAREGIYPEVIAADVSPQRLQRFFYSENGSYRVKREVREVVLFAEHNLLSDPPFSRQDLVSCRNLLIYLQREVQADVIELFHYALKAESFLFLGSSESLGDAGLFRAIDKKRGLYQRQAVVSTHPKLPSLPLTPRQGTIPQSLPAKQPIAPAARSSFGAVHLEMLERYAPPSLLINEDFNIVHLSQHAGRYLHQPGGDLTHNVLQRVLPALRMELMMALYGVIEQDQPLRTKPVHLTVAGERRQVSMSVHPATTSGMEGYLLIIFLERGGAAPGVSEGGEDQDTAVVVQDLEAELSRTKERMQTAVEEFESSKEEMGAANEELRSMNEELRSTAEELETSKEELQSMNEELVTLNQEYQNKVDELSQLSSDLQNLLASTDVATIFLDRNLCIRRFTPQVGELFNIIEVDQGRPLAHITHKLQDGDMLQDAELVLASLLPVEKEIKTEDGRFYLVRLRPYRSVEDRIEGVVITFVDVTDLKRTEAELRASNEFQKNILHTVREGLLVLSFELTVEFANDSFLQMFQVSAEETIGKLVYELGNGQWDIPELRTLLEEGLPHNESFSDYEVRHAFEDIGERVMMLNGRRLNDRQLILLAIEDITERHDALMELQRYNETLEEEVARRTRKIRDLASELLVAEQNVRRRVAQVLHDDLQQILYSIRMSIQMLGQDLNQDDDSEVAAEIEQLDKLVNEAYVLTRQTSTELSPPMPMSEDFGQAVIDLIAHVEGLHHLQVAVSVDGPIQVEDDNLALVLLYILRELLFNVVKHAGVDTAEVTVKQENKSLSIIVADKGQGFDVARLMQQQSGSGYGLYSIQERLQLLDGEVTVDSMVGDGTQVTITVPHIDRVV